MKTFVKLLMLVFILSLLCSCTGETTSEKAATDNVEMVKKAKEAVRIAYFPNITHAQALIGREGGFFEKNMGDAKLIWKEFNAGPSVIEALLAGEIDIGYIGPVPAINGFEKSGGELKIIAGASGYGAVLVGRSGLKITEINQLKGKKVSVPQFFNTQDICLRNLLKINGLKDTAHGGDVEVVQVNNPDVKTLMDNGRLDAALVPEPWASQLISDIKAEVILDYDRIWNDGIYPSALVVATVDFMNKHKNLIEKFMETHVEVTQYLNSHPGNSKKLINARILKSTGKLLKDDILDSSLKRLVISYEPMAESLSEFIDILSEMGLMKEKPELTKLLDTNALNGVLADKGLKQVK